MTNGLYEATSVGDFPSFEIVIVRPFVEQDLAEVTVGPGRRWVKTY